MAAPMQTYEVWLTKRLLELNPDTDTDVFVSYITGILEEDVPKEEKMESITDFISQVVEENMETVCDELYRKWEQFSGNSQEQKDKDKDADKLTDHLATILEKQKIEVVKTKEKTAEEIARKQAILSQYREVASGDEDEDSGNDDSGGRASGKGDNLLDFQNTNADLVKQIELEKREKSKLDSEKKKEKDKQEREAQKQKKTDRKDQEKKRTQKGEKRR